MNRQLVAFLSLFSLTLVLSVYYVLIPTANNSNNIENNNSNPVTGVVLDAESAYFETLDIQRDSYYQDYYNEQNSILASSSYSNSEKEQALLNIELIKAQEKELENLEVCVKGIGYQNVFIEYINDDIHVVTSSIDEKNHMVEAAQIIFTIQDLLDKEENIFVVYNANKETVKIDLPEKDNWKIYIQKDKASAEPLEELSKRSSKAEVAGVSCFVAVATK